VGKTNYGRKEKVKSRQNCEVNFLSGNGKRGKKRSLGRGRRGEKHPDQPRNGRAKKQVGVGTMEQENQFHWGRAERQHFDCRKEKGHRKKTKGKPEGNRKTV